MRQASPPTVVPPIASAQGRPWRSRLWRKHAAVMVALCVAAIGGFGGVELMVTFADAKTQAGQLQRAQANEAALALRAALVNIDRHVGAVNELPWQPGWLSLDTRREEFARLLRMVPAAESISYRDGGGSELLSVSRREVDRLASPASLAAAAAASAAQDARPAASAARARVQYTRNHEPVLDVALPDSGPALAGTTVVRIGLRALARELRGSLSLPEAEVYAVDEGGVIALHRDPSVMLQRLAAPMAPGQGLRGTEVLREAVPIAELGWTMVVERPRAAVMAPVWAIVRRAAWVLLLGVLVAGGAALMLAGRLTRPIRQLHRAAARVAAGHLDTSITINTRDELQDLAAQFNQMAASLQASITDLEDRIAARTLELQRANRHKSEFLANMSHELRTPLNAVLGFADVLREGMAGPLNDEQREYVADIHASGLHLLALINDVLDLSKIEAGQLALELSEFSVPDAVAAAMALVRQHCAHKGLALTLALTPEVGTWTADGRRFKQVLVNLLSNAVKFTPAGGTVGVRGGIDADEGLWIEVQDNGVGIAAADHATVFEEFRQVGVDAAGRAEGTGLGLALVRRLVEQHGGQVTLQSALGMGSRFRFNIPLGPVNAMGGLA